jgi:hypothetical protein
MFTNTGSGLTNGKCLVWKIVYFCNSFFYNKKAEIYFGMEDTADSETTVNECDNPVAPNHCSKLPNQTLCIPVSVLHCLSSVGSKTAM